MDHGWSSIPERRRRRRGNLAFISTVVIAEMVIWIFTPNKSFDNKAGCEKEPCVLSPIDGRERRIVGVGRDSVTIVLNRARVIGEPFRERVGAGVWSGNIMKHYAVVHDE